MSIIEGAWRLQRAIEDRFAAAAHGKVARIIRMAKKPGDQEYWNTVRIAAIGLIIVGLMGFFTYLLVGEGDTLLHTFIHP